MQEGVLAGSPAWPHATLESGHAPTFQTGAAREGSSIECSIELRGKGQIRAHDRGRISYSEKGLRDRIFDRPKSIGMWGSVREGRPRKSEGGGADPRLG